MKFRDQVLNELEKTNNQLSSAIRGMELKQITPDTLFNMLKDIGQRTEQLMTIIRRESAD